MGVLLPRPPHDIQSPYEYFTEHNCVQDILVSQRGAVWENLDARFSVSCIFCHSLDSFHSEEPAASVADSMEESVGTAMLSDTDSVYIPTPERPVALKVSHTDLPNEVTIMEVSQLEMFVESINEVLFVISTHCGSALVKSVKTRMR